MTTVVSRSILIQYLYNVSSGHILYMCKGGDRPATTHALIHTYVLQNYDYCIIIPQCICQLHGLLMETTISSPILVRKVYCIPQYNHTTLLYVELIEDKTCPVKLWIPRDLLCKPMSESLSGCKLVPE